MTSEQIKEVLDQHKLTHFKISAGETALLERLDREARKKRNRELLCDFLAVLLMIPGVAGLCLLLWVVQILIHGG